MQLNRQTNTQFPSLRDAIPPYDIPGTGTHVLHKPNSRILPSFCTPMHHKAAGTVQRGKGQRQESEIPGERDRGPQSLTLTCGSDARMGRAWNQ